MKLAITMLRPAWLTSLPVRLPTFLDQRFVRWSIYFLAIALFTARYIHLTADFPNYSLWMIDQSKFTDEGWWSSAAVMHFITGHWYVPGDYNPGVAEPIWPLLLGALFSFTGISIAAARALNVTLSIAAACATAALAARIGRRDSNLAAPESKRYSPLALLLLAASPFAYVFSRLAILDTLITLEFTLLLLLATRLQVSRLQNRQWLRLASIALLASIMLLSKSTSALLLPAVLWLTFWTLGHTWRAVLKSITAVIIIPALLFKAWELLVTLRGYGPDYHYFYDFNAMDDFDWSRIWTTLSQLVQNGIMIDRLLYPAILLAFVLIALALILYLLARPFLRSPLRPTHFLLPLRHLFANPLFVACILAIAAEALYILRRQDDFAPRYLLVMLAPLVLITLILLARLFESRSPLTHLLLLVIFASVLINALTIADFLHKPTYQYIHAADSIANIIRTTPNHPQLIFGVSGSQLSLMSGIPSINDAYSLQPMPAKLARYNPGWYLAWNSIASSNAGLLSPYTLQKVASYPVFDDDDRNHLIFYRMTALHAAAATASPVR
jgi:hypothetical protein